jgi:hypothetical protein
MFGVEVHANIINTLLTQNYLKPLESGWRLFFTTVALAIAALSLLRLRLTAAAVATATYIFVYMLAGFWLFATKNLILPLAELISTSGSCAVAALPFPRPGGGREGLPSLFIGDSCCLFSEKIIAKIGATRKISTKFGIYPGVCGRRA